MSLPGHKAPSNCSTLTNACRPNTSRMGSTDASPSYEASADRLLDILAGEELDSSGRERNPIQPHSNTKKGFNLDFDLYAASCSDTTTQSADCCSSMIKGLGPTLRGYLLDQSWNLFNSCIPVVHKGAFLASLEEGKGEFCSPQLHLAALAMGFRRADHRHPDILQLSLPGWDSILHKQLRLSIDNLSTHSGPRNITNAQAAIILGQLEWERGRDHSARLYLGDFASSTTTQETQYSQLPQVLLSP